MPSVLRNGSNSMLLLIGKTTTLIGATMAGSDNTCCVGNGSAAMIKQYAEVPISTYATLLVLLTRPIVLLQQAIKHSPNAKRRLNHIGRVDMVC